MAIRITPLTDPASGPTRRRLVWLASDAAGTPVGSAFLGLATQTGQDHRAELDLRVHPAERCGGVGSRLLEAAVTAARQDGRRCVTAQAAPGSPGEGFLRARGFRRVLALMFARLPLTGADVGALTGIVEQPHPGYRLADFSGAVPDDLAETFAASRRAMDDMDGGTVVWDVDRVRAVAEAVRRRGDLLHTVVAVHEGDGSVVGFTELVVPGDGEGDGVHYGTAVLPGHRGHGLGRWMKAASIRHAVERHPGLGGLVTDTAASNPYMRAVNDSLGYVPTHTACEYQLDL